MVDKDDWRLGSKKKYLQGVTLQWKRYTKYRPGWEHDHCAFCLKEFMDADRPEVLREGYATDDNYYWICKQCYEDFREPFQWKLREKIAESE